MTTEKLEEFRKFVNDNLEENNAIALCDQDDIQRFNTDDKFAKGFLEQSLMNFNDGCTMVEQCLIWRNSFGVNSITEDSLDKKLLSTGIFYMRGRGINGSPILRAQMCHNPRGTFPAKSLQQLFVYILEQHSIRSYTPIIVLFDLTNTGVKHIDLDMVRFMISCFKIYYPMMLDMILAFDMPWVMNAAWKIIKTWLGPSASDKVGFVDAVTINRYIVKEHLVVHMGGKDNYVFNGKLFSDEEDVVEREMRVTYPQNSLANSMEVKNSLLITPAEEITFDLNDFVPDTCQLINLRNNGEKTVAYKFKSTSPEKFYVRPGMGTLPANKEIGVRINLTSEALASATVSEDKFLLLYKFLDEPLNIGVREFWRQSSNNGGTQTHRIRCSIFPSLNGTPVVKAALPNTKSEKSSSCDNQKGLNVLLKTLQDDQTRLRREVRIVGILVLIVILISIMNLTLMMGRFR